MLMCLSNPFTKLAIDYVTSIPCFSPDLQLTDSTIESVDFGY